MVEQRLVDRPDALERTRVQVAIPNPAAAGSFLARVSVVDAAGQRSSRELADTSCSALAHALSLIVALIVEEGAATGGAPAAASGADSSAKDEWGVDPPDPIVVDSGVADPVQNAAFRLGPLLRSSLQSGLAPRPVLGAGGGIRLEWGGARRWSPLIELAVMRFDSPRFKHSVEAEVRFDALVIDALLCPVDLAPGADWSLRPCLELEVGRLTVEGSGRGVARPEARTAPALSSGVSMQGEFAPWAGPLHISLAVGGFVSLYRGEFYFSPDIEAFAVPAVGWRGSAGLGATF